MNNVIKLAVSAALALGATSAFATNGDLMIGQGAKSRAMGGVGIAKAFGAESALANPANISSVENSEATLAVTVFMPSVSFGTNAASNANPAAAGQAVPILSEDSDANLSVIPEIYYATRLSDKVVLGLAVSGTAGMGVDYDDVPFNVAGDNGAFRMKTTLELLKIAVPISYTTGGLTLGAAGVLQYGSLAMSHMTNAGFLDNGPSTDIGYGLEVGATYKTGGLTVGAVYKSEIGMTYDNTISSSLVAFGANQAITSGDKLDQPAERGIGISYEMGANTISADFKTIAWGDAAGYADFGWENQNVYALGYEHSTNDWAFRAGYNYAKSPIVEQDASKGFGAQGVTNYIGGVQNFFNLAGFPGIVETHYSIGGGMNFGDFTIDGSLIYVPKTTVSYDTSSMTEAFAYGGAIAAGADAATAAAGATGTAESSADVTHGQMGITIAGTYRF